MENINNFEINDILFSNIIAEKKKDTKRNL